MALTYQITRRLSLNSFFTYKTGRPVTLPVGYYTQNNMKVPLYEDRNASRFPDYNRLDISAEFKSISRKQEKRHWQSTFILSVYNVYNKKISLFYGIDQQSSLNNIGAGIMPSITYNFRF
jgi:hypothetical protein